jgi:hypothetical protein
MLVPCMTAFRDADGDLSKVGSPCILKITEPA